MDRPARFVHIACLLSSTLNAVGTAQDVVVRGYDLRDFDTPLPGAPGRWDTPHLLLPIGPVLPVGDRVGSVDGGPVGLEPTLVPRIPRSELCDWLAGHGQWDGGQVTLQDDGRMILRAHAGVHARVKDVLSVFAAVQQRRVSMTLYELPLGAGANGEGVLTAAQVDALLQASPPVRATAATVATDVPWLHDNGRSVRYIKDFEVEVAEKSVIADPKMDAYFVGTRLGVCVTPLADGRMLVRAGVHHTDPIGALRPRPLPGRGLGILQLPDVQAMEARASAVLSPGGGLLVTVGMEQAAWLLRLQPVEAPPLRVGGAAALPLGHLAVVPMATPGPIDLVVRPGESRDFEEPERTTPDLRTAIEAALASEVDVDNRHLRGFGSHVILIDEPGLQARLEKALLRQAKALRPATLSFRLGQITHDLALRHLAGLVPMSELAAAVPAVGSVATLPEHGFALSLRRERSFLRDLEVEIASKAGIANPVVDTVFSGFRLRGVARSADGGAMRVAIHMSWSEVPSFQPIDLGNADLGDVDAPTTAWTEFDDSLLIGSGDWHVAYLAPDPLGPETKSLLLMVRLQLAPQ